MFFPGPYRVPKASFNYKTVFSNTAGLRGLPRPVAVRDAGPRNPARHRGAPDGHRSRRAAPPQHPARRRDAVLQPQRHAVRPRRTRRTPSSRPSRSSTTRASARSRPTRWPQGRYIGLGFSAYIEPTGAATGHLGTEGATIRMEPTGKINVYVNGGSTGNSIETTVVQLTADALGRRHRRRRHDPGRHRRDARSAPAPRAAAAVR